MAVVSAFGTAGLLVLLLVLGSARFVRASCTVATWRRLAVLSEASGLGSKGKQLVSFCAR